MIGMDDRRQAIFRRQLDDRSPVRQRVAVGQNNQAAVGLFTEVGDRALDLPSRMSTPAIVIPSDRATASAERIIARSIGVSEPNSTATRRIFAAVSLSTLSHLPPISGSKDQKPVRLPPGRARFVTRPLSMGLCQAASAGFRTCTGRRSNGWPAR
jgi:hypothetical protein